MINRSVLIDLKGKRIWCGSSNKASGYQYEEDNNSLVISNPKGDIVYIKIAISKTLKKILFSKTDNNENSFKSFNFNITSGEISFKKFMIDFFGTDK